MFFPEEKAVCTILMYSHIRFFWQSLAACFFKRIWESIFK